MYDTDFLYGPKMNEFFHNVFKEFLNLYSKFATLEKIMLTEFHVNQDSINLFSLNTDSYSTYM